MLNGEMTSTAEVTAGTEAPVSKELFATLYGELHRMAARELQRNVPMTLGPTTLLHETFLSLSPQAVAGFASQNHFVAYAARAMRGLIVDHLRSRRARKRGRDYHITSLPTELPHAPELDTEIEQIAEALDELAAVEPRLTECVELKFFCGFSLVQIAELWGVSERTVQRDWDKARVLLQRFIKNRAPCN